MLIARFPKVFYLCNSLLLIAAPYTASRQIRPAPCIARYNCQEKIPVDSIITGGHASTEPDLVSEIPQFKLNKKEALFVRTYIKKRGDCLYNVKKRSYIPFYIIDSVFRLYNLPVELKYLSVIESELKTSAKSPVGARGPWQLMPGTARILGLKVNRKMDERTNYSKSTKAAARYLKDLYAQFDDWLLVLAAYNGGPKPVINAIRASGSRNFWVLQKWLPAESRQHVKKFIATHYYFEGQGSETTLTRRESLAYLRAINAFHILKAGADVRYTIKQKMEPDNKPESSEEKFKRVMQESEEGLKKSRKLI